MSHLVLIDGHHLMYRAYWAIPRTLKTSSGEQTNTVFGMVSMLLNILRIEEPDALLFCFDAGEETFRHQEDETYKDGRAETPDDFYDQIPRVIEMIETFQIPHVSDPTYEADDFLASYARAGEEAGMQVTIITGDRDALQIASPKTRIAIPHKGYQQTEYLDPEGVLSKYGVRPDQVAAYKGLCGDASDNLPGVKGIGPKTAATLLQEYDTLGGIYEHLQDLRPNLREKLERDWDQALFCEQMATLMFAIDPPVSLDDLSMKEKPVADVFSLLTELEFSMLLKRFQALLDSPYGQKSFNVDERTDAAVSSEEEQLVMF